MATIGDHWALGYRDTEEQPIRTSITGSTIVAADDFGDLGNRRTGIGSAGIDLLSLEDLASRSAETL